MSRSSATTVSEGGGASSTLVTITITDPTYTAGTSNEDVILADATSNNVIITLPLATSNLDRRFYIKKTNRGRIVEINGNASETIDGKRSITLALQYSSLTLISDGNEWFII